VPRKPNTGDFGAILRISAMKLVLRNPPLWILLPAIALDLSIQRSSERRAPRKQRWLWRQIDRLLGAP
jgi:hypothetical protein